MSASPERSTRAAEDRALFNRIAGQYCRKDLSPSSRPARAHRLLSTLDAAPLPADARILEIGCGAGFSPAYMKGRFGSFVGLDYAEELVNFARERNAGPGVEFVAADMFKYQPDELFDAVVMIGVLHHIDDVAAGMAQLVRFLKPGGYILVNEPQRGNVLISAARRIRTRVDSAYSPDQVEFSADELRSAFEKAGLQDVAVTPQGFFSTPFAEVVLPPEGVMGKVAQAACSIDRGLERAVGSVGRYVSWNLIARGRRA